jgi:exoribonuclease-2
MLIHIAAPGLAVQPGSPIDAVGRPAVHGLHAGLQLTMLPTRSFSTTRCQEGRNRLALSLYVTMDEALAITATATRLEQVPIAANLRHDVLDSTFTKRFLKRPTPAHRPAVAWGTATVSAPAGPPLKAGREVVRGKPENFNRPDYLAGQPVRHRAARP